MADPASKLAAIPSDHDGDVIVVGVDPAGSTAAAEHALSNYPMAMRMRSATQ